MVTWIVLRAAGIAAYLMLWATVTWGLIGTTSLVGKRVARATATTIHQFLANTALLLLGVHIGGLLLDTYVRFAPIDILLPLHTTHRAVPVAIGIIGMYAFLVVLVTSWIRKHLSTRIWRAAHLLAVPAFALALVHGVFAGTDTVRPVDVVGIRRDRRFRPVPHVDPRLDDRVATPTAGTAGGAVRGASTAGDGGRRRAVSDIRVESVSRERQSRGS